jgi:uncharacterized protein YrzB (UPF0473 family)
MAKEKVRQMTGLFASIFAHTGHISKEDAKEISGLDDHGFEQVYEKASRIAKGLSKAEGKKMDVLLKHFGKEIDDWKEIGPIF